MNRVITTLDSPPSTATFSMQVDFSMGETVDTWFLGFYMPRTFNALGSVNPGLTMQIVDQAAPGSPATLQFVTSSINSTVFGDSYANVVNPATSFPLVQGHSYTLRFSNNNQFAPENLSAVAQNFFLYNVSQPQFLNSTVLISAYGSDINTLTNIGGYDYAAVEEQIEQEIDSNWANSAPPVPGQLADVYHLVPTPQSMTGLGGRGASLFRRRSVAVYSAFTHQALTTYLNADLNIQVISVTNPKNADIVIQQSNGVSNLEGYTLQIQNNQIIIGAATDTGAFYAVQTLRQLWHQTLALPPVSINDYPRFKYRGILLDVARHFLNVGQIKILIDAMAAQKLNTLHIHFSDDEGFRLDLSSLLVNVVDLAQLRGFVSSSTNVPAVFSQANLDITNFVNNQPSSNLSNLIVSTYPQANTAYQGLYSAQDIVILVAYANQNKITVIPELDFPGHARAIVHADPAVFIDPNDTSQYLSVQAYYDDVIPVCQYNNTESPINAFTNTMNNIMLAVSGLFANQSTLYYQNEVSLGADEVSSNAWTSDTTCSGSTPWSGYDALQRSQYLFQLMGATAAPSNIKISGYQQIVQTDSTSLGTAILPASQAGHVWAWGTAHQMGSIGIAQAQVLAQNGYPTVLSFADDLYFDLAYTPNAWEPGFSWAAPFLDTHAALYSALDAQSTLSGLTGSEQQYILGLEGSLWGENMMNFTHLAYMALPKMTGLSEAAWASANTTVVSGQLNWQSLAIRLGTDSNGFLNYLYSITGLQYRGYPNGISMEIPN